MKKFISIFSIFLFLLLSINTLNAFAQPRTLIQGVYNARDSNLLVGAPITVRIASPNNRAMIIIIDSNEIIQELVRLGPEFPEHILRPLNYDSNVVIISDSGVILS